MNLFRSEEHVTGWAQYDPASHQSIMPVTDWCYALGADVFSKRLEPDYLDHIDPYFENFYGRLAELGKTGDFWRLPRHQRDQPDPG